jgi:hypothetical protein
MPSFAAALCSVPDDVWLTIYYVGGGISLTTNRTYWPTTEATLAFQPGWFVGHATAMLQVNLGMGTDGPDGGPLEMSNQIVPPFSLIGPSNNPFPGTLCLDKIPLPTDIGIKAGVNATIQIVMTAQHGAALFSVSCKKRFDRWHACCATGLTRR